MQDTKMRGMNRKDMTEILLVQWSRFGNVHIRMNGSTLFTGVNGSGKSTVLDALTYLFTGNTQFNKAAQDKDRSVLSYVRGDTKSNGSDRFLRRGELVSYIAAQFFSPLEDEPFVVGVCIEAPDETGYKSSWFVKKNAKISDFNFYEVKEKLLHVTPKNELRCGNERMRAAEYLPKERGIEQVMRALGLRCDAAKYRSKLMKMMAFSPENNINRFIAQSVLEPKPITSVSVLREQKQKYEQIKKLYDDLNRQKEQLICIEEKIAEYEKLEDMFRFRKVLYACQEFALASKKQQNMETHERIIKRETAQLTQELESATRDVETATAQLAQADANCSANDLNQGLQQVRSQLLDVADKIRACEAQTARIEKLQAQMEQADAIFAQETSLDETEREVLKKLLEPSISVQEKSAAVEKMQVSADALQERYRGGMADIARRQQESQERISRLEKDCRQLKNHRMVYDEQCEKEKKMLADELERRGIKTDVRYFCELVKEIREPQWQAAIEAHLGWRRYDLIVEERYCHEALKALEDKKLRAVTVVLTDKLPKPEPEEGSAAQLLDVANAEALKYANLLLSHMHLCENIEQLHEYPRGGLMKNGMRAVGYRVSRMNLKKLTCCMGQNAIELQLKQKEQALSEEKQAREELNAQYAALSEKLDMIKQIHYDPQAYSFYAVAELEKLRARQQELKQEQEKIEKDPGLMDLMNKRSAAFLQLTQAQKYQKELTISLGGKQSDERRLGEEKKELAEQVAEKESIYQRLLEQNEDLRVKTAAEYRIQSEKKKDGVVVTPASLAALEKRCKQCADELEERQIAYCTLIDDTKLKRGVSYIPYYRTLHSDIGNVKIEETKERLKNQHQILESAFMNDFVSELVENIHNAKLEIEQINRELKTLPFGSDVYTFKMTERADKAGFFKIAKKISGYMNNLEFYMATNREDEELEEQIHEFMDRVIEDENEAEYIDYRNYFRYDMEIVNKSSGREITTELSVKQGSASGGEKQTPYFIILAASLMQCYPADACCARIAFIDEAFSALSRERIERMVCYFEQNHFQVMYAAPPEKIDSIGSYIDTTVSLVQTGRYTTAVEGLIKKG